MKRDHLIVNEMYLKNHISFIKSEARVANVFTVMRAAKRVLHTYIKSNPEIAVTIDTVKS